MALVQVVVGGFCMVVYLLPAMIGQRPATACWKQSCLVAVVTWLNVWMLNTGALHNVDNAMAFDG